MVVVLYINSYGSSEVIIYSSESFFIVLTNGTFIGDYIYKKVNILEKKCQNFILSIQNYLNFHKREIYVWI